MNMGSTAGGAEKTLQFTIQNRHKTWRRDTQRQETHRNTRDKEVQSYKEIQRNTRRDEETQTDVSRLRFDF